VGAASRRGRATPGRMYRGERPPSQLQRAAEVRPSGFQLQLKAVCVPFGNQCPVTICLLPLQPKNIKGSIEIDAGINLNVGNIPLRINFNPV